jgi:arylformamidase
MERSIFGLKTVGDGAQVGQCLGTDYLGIEPHDHAEPLTHRLLFAAGIAVIEGLDPRRVQQGEYFMACLPLRLQDADGAPARAVLVPLGDLNVRG